MRNDSLIVGLFILLHVGSRLLAASFEIARNGSDNFQPAATTIALLWSDLSQESVLWWIVCAANETDTATRRSDRRKLQPAGGRSTGWFPAPLRAGISAA